MSEFLKKAFESGRVKEVYEAYKEYPVEEELHNIDFYVNEEITIYSKYNIGDIVYVDNFKYPNGSNGNNHLFVIIDESNIAVPLEYFGMILSSKVEKVKYDSNILLKKDRHNNLKSDSIIKTDFLYRIFEQQIIGKIGSVSIEDIDKYKKFYLNSDKKYSFI